MTKIKKIISILVIFTVLTGLTLVSGAHSDEEIIGVLLPDVRSLADEVDTFVSGTRDSVAVHSYCWYEALYIDVPADEVPALITYLEEQGFVETADSIWDGADGFWEGLKGKVLVAFGLYEDDFYIHIWLDGIKCFDCDKCNLCHEAEGTDWCDDCNSCEYHCVCGDIEDTATVENVVAGDVAAAEKQSPPTGIAGVAVSLAAAVIAAGTLTISRKKR